MDIRALKLTCLKRGRKMASKLNPSQKEVLIEQGKALLASYRERKISRKRKKANETAGRLVNSSINRKNISKREESLFHAFGSNDCKLAKIRSKYLKRAKKMSLKLDLAQKKELIEQGKKLLQLYMKKRSRKTSNAQGITGSKSSSLPKMDINVSGGSDAVSDRAVERSHQASVAARKMPRKLNLAQRQESIEQGKRLLQLYVKKKRRKAGNMQGIACSRVLSLSKSDVNVSGGSGTVSDRTVGRNQESVATKPHRGRVEEVRKVQEVREELVGRKVCKEYVGSEECAEREAGDNEGCRVFDGSEACVKSVKREVREEERAGSEKSGADVCRISGDEREESLLKTQQELVTMLRKENSHLKMSLEREKAERRGRAEELCSKHEEVLKEISSLEKSMSEKEAILCKLRQIVTVAKNQANSSDKGEVKKLAMKLEAVLDSSTESSDIIGEEIFDTDLVGVLLKCQERAHLNNRRIDALVRKCDHYREGQNQNLKDGSGLSSFMVTLNI